MAHYNYESRKEELWGKPANEWWTDRGDATHRLDYDLSPDSLVFDIGGFRGDFASAIHERYGCEIHVFEPISGFYNSIKSRFEHKPLVHTHPFGVSELSQQVEIKVDHDTSSIYKSEGKREVIQLTEIGEIMDQLSVENINLVKINIEGGEYSLLEHCLKNQLVSKMENIQVQFHTFMDDATSKRKDLQRQLSDTHELTYNYAFIWENWKRKTLP